ncbi:MAG: hypothetical protein V3W19_10370 [Desulfatiglandales bacterium]
MDREEYMAYKKARLEEISAVIKESGERVKDDPPEIEDIQEKLEKLKNNHPWLK